MKNSVFFLGAGFSKAICDSYPDLTGLSKEIAEQYVKDTNDPLALYFHNNIPEEYKDNIELLLTYLSGHIPYKTDVQVLMDEALYKDITKKIANKFYSMSSNSPNYLEKCDNIIRYIKEKSCSCITLNYDLLLENLILSFFKKNNIDTPQKGFPQFYKYPINNPYRNNGLGYISIDEVQKIKKYISPEQIPNIIKLHGSINWQLTDFSTSGIVQYEENYDKSLLSPFIIPPILDKTILYENLTLKKCWNLAFETIKNAPKIFIYGFSFPETDLAIKFLFQSALNKNQNTPKIYVINTNSILDKKSNYYAKERYETIFKKCEINYDFCCENSLNLFNDKIYDL